MNKIDQNAVAVNAAGIADAFRVLQVCDHDGAARMDDLARTHEGWVGVTLQIANAGALMERARAAHGATARWGGELPSLYDVWDAIAQALWDQLGSVPIELLVQRAIEEAVSAEVA